MAQGRVQGRQVTDKGSRIDRENEISPGSTPSEQRSRAQIAPWDNSGPPEFGNYRRDLSILDNSSGRIPSIRQQPPGATASQQWAAPKSNAVMPSSVFGSFYNDSNEDVGQLSPGFRPGNGRDDMGFPEENRRPSIASNATVSSSGSRASISRGFHKKLHGFFGDEYLTERQNSDASTSQPPSTIVGDGASARMRNRNNSLNNTLSSSVGSRPESPTHSRPRTPLASSEVTPWEFQDFKVHITFIILALDFLSAMAVRSCDLRCGRICRARTTKKFPPALFGILPHA